MRTAHLHLGPDPVSEAQDVTPTCPAATQVTMLSEQVDSSLIFSQHSCMCKCVLRSQGFTCHMPWRRPGGFL